MMRSDSHRRYQIQIVQTAEVKLNRKTRLNCSHEEKDDVWEEVVLERPARRESEAKPGVKNGEILTPPLFTAQINSYLILTSHREGYQIYYIQMAFMLHISSTSLQSDGSHTSIPTILPHLYGPLAARFESEVRYNRTSPAGHSSLGSSRRRWQRP